MAKRLFANPLFKFLVTVAAPLIALFCIYFKVAEYYQIVVILFMINVILTASLNITNGFIGIFSMGQAGFMAIGAYAGSLLTMSADLKISRIPGIPEWLANVQLPFIPALIIAGMVAAAAAVIFGFPVLRAKGHYLAVMTLGMIIIIKAILDNNSNLTNGAKGISGMERFSTLPVVFAVMIVSLFFLYRMTKSAFGRSMAAIRSDADAASSLGINATKYRMIAFVVSAFFGAVGGALWAHLQQTIAPSLFYFSRTFSIIEMSVLGGMSTLSGAFPGAAIVTFVPQILANFENGFKIFGFDVPALNGLSAIVMSIVFILVIIKWRGGVTRGSEYIVNAMFGKDTWTGILRKQTYIDFWNILCGGFKNSIHYHPHTIEEKEQEKKNEQEKNEQ
ncbi:branched-chain amino acid ABC transporter permease [Clostridia bacterium]|nr:branched-chain amino acid ABC transporter permease [Clostridia bacterium]